MKKIDFFALLIICIGIFSTFFLVLDYINQQKPVYKLKDTMTSGEANELNFNIEETSISSNVLKIKGWAFPEDDKIREINIILKSNPGDLYRLRTTKEVRKDVSAFFNNGKNYDDSGFISKIGLNDFTYKGNYKVGIQLIGEKQEYFLLTDKTIYVE